MGRNYSSLSIRHLKSRAVFRPGFAVIVDAGGGDIGVAEPGHLSTGDALEPAGRLCHGNSIEHAWRTKLATRHAAATASFHCAVDSVRKIRSVDREMRCR
jgi:hypothetical protein